jgi:hypothetical protein
MIGLYTRKYLEIIVYKWSLDMSMIGFHVRLNEDIAEIYDQLSVSLGPPKYKIIEAAIEVFAALPKEAQYVLKSQDENDRKLILDLIRAMNVKGQKGKRA